jgi:hypothetical protein
MVFPTLLLYCQKIHTNLLADIRLKLLFPLLFLQFPWIEYIAGRGEGCSVRISLKSFGAKIS